MSVPAAGAAPEPDAAAGRAPDDTSRVQIFASLPEPLVAAVARLVDAATEADGVRPLSEHVRLHVRLGGEGPDRHLALIEPDGEVVAYAHLDPTDILAGPTAELVVHPARRRRGHGRRLVEAAVRVVPDDRLRLWAHGDHPAARALAAGLGFREGRRLEQWRRSLHAPLPRVELPAGVTLRTFRPGEDDDAWLTVNARAFADHPEQGAWTARDLRVRRGEDWFDPAGFFLAEEKGKIIGFHWTKVHGVRRHDHHGHSHIHDPIGEVYVVGVDPSARGRGLGRALTVVGLAWLRAADLPQAMLYVESDNLPARATYTGLGFAHWDTDVMFYRSHDVYRSHGTSKANSPQQGS